MYQLKEPGNSIIIRKTKVMSLNNGASVFWGISVEMWRTQQRGVCFLILKAPILITSYLKAVHQLNKAQSLNYRSNRQA